MVFDVIGGEILDRSTALVRAGGTLVTIVRVPTVQPKDGRAIFFVVEADRSRLADLAQRLQGRTAQADRRGSTAARRSACSVRPRPAHPRQDDHPDQPAKAGSSPEGSCRRLGRYKKVCIPGTRRRWRAQGYLVVQRHAAAAIHTLS